MDNDGTGSMFSLMLIIGIIGVVGFVLTAMMAVP